MERTFDSCHAADSMRGHPEWQGAIETLRAEPKAVHFVREFLAADKPFAAIADGVSMLVAADAATGARSRPAHRQQMNAGGGRGGSRRTVHVDGKMITARDYMTSSRSPGHTARVRQPGR